MFQIDLMSRTPVYELLTTKRIRNLVHILPRTGILAIINVVLIGCLIVAKNLACSNIPDSSDIKSVSFAFNNLCSSELLGSSATLSCPFTTDTSDCRYWS